MSEAAVLPTVTPLTSPSVSRDTGCPLREGALTLDTLLAELGPTGGDALDRALDLRFALQEGRDANACVTLALHLGRELGERHYLAFYRVRLWLARRLAAEVRAHRGDNWTRVALPFDACFCSPERLERTCIARWSQEQAVRPTLAAQCRFVFANSR